MKLLFSHIKQSPEDFVLILYAMIMPPMLLVDVACGCFCGLQTGLILIVSTLSLVLPFVTCGLMLEDARKKTLTAALSGIVAALVIVSALGIYNGELYLYSQLFYLAYISIVLVALLVFLCRKKGFGEGIRDKISGLILLLCLIVIPNALLFVLHLFF